jgi:hypothetical protein
METTGRDYKYIEWKSSEEMHFSSLQWISELNFIKDEHLFFEDMLKEYTLPIIESHLFNKVKDLIDRLIGSKDKADSLLKRITEHRNGLQIMVDGINQIEEEKKYKEDHRSLLKEVMQFSNEYNAMKKEIFETVSQALKQQKHKRLLS